VTAENHPRWKVPAREKASFWQQTLLMLALFPAIWIFFRVLALAVSHLPEPIGPHSGLLVEGARVTLILTAVSGTAGVIIGLLLGMAKTSWWPLLRWCASTLIWIIRGTPLLVQILFVYYALPAISPTLRFGEMGSAFIALALNVGCYNAEIIRAGIEAVPTGQTEAALSLGLSRFMTMRYIVVPQAFRIVIPPLINNVVALLKDSSLVSAIGLLDLTLAGNRISSETFLPVPVLTTVAFIYLMLTTCVTAITTLAEKRMQGRRA
jgi:polar amino acid transport system permease protein